jgi:hypothetical protein
MIYAAIWAGLVMLAGSYFQFSSNAARKRRLFPVFTIGSATVFVLLISAHGASLPMMIFLGLGVAAIAAIQLYRVRFCDACGATAGLHERTFTRLYDCPKCGAKLD